MKNIFFLIPFVLLWVWLTGDKRKATTTAAPEGQAAQKTTPPAPVPAWTPAGPAAPAAPAPIPGAYKAPEAITPAAVQKVTGITYVAPETVYTPAPAYIAPKAVPAYIAPPAYKVDPTTTYTPPAPIAAALAEVKAAEIANVYRPEALAAEAALQAKEAERLAAEAALRAINQKIAADAAAGIQAAAATLAAQKAAADKLAADNAALARDLAFKASQAQAQQYAAAAAPELQRLNAFLSVKQEVSNSAMYTMQRLSLLMEIKTIQGYYQRAYDEKVKGNITAAQDMTDIAELAAANLAYEMANIERQYVAQQAAAVNALFLTQQQAAAKLAADAAQAAFLAQISTPQAIPGYDYTPVPLVVAAPAAATPYTETPAAEVTPYYAEPAPVARVLKGSFLLDTSNIV